MSFCSFAEGAAMFDVTPIDNLFLMQYMYDAPAPALKVYLYAKMMALHPELNGSLEDLSQELHLSMEDVYGAFNYWEKLGLIRRLTDQPPTYSFQPLRVMDNDSDLPLNREMTANRDFNNSLRRLFGDQFIGDHEIRKAADWQNILKFDQDAILRMVEYAIKLSPRKNPRPPSVFKRVDKLAEEWSRRDIHTLEQVERAIDDASSIDDTLRAVFSKMGITRKEATEPELEAVRRWIRDWGYSREEILAACDDTLNARNPSIKYLDTILEKRREEPEGDYAELQEILREMNPMNARPTPEELKRYQALKGNNISPEMIRQAAIQCRRANKNRFEDLEWRLETWLKERIDTPEAAENWMRDNTRLSKQVRQLFSRAGYDDRRPSYGDIATYRQWQSLYPEDMILYAAECSQNAGGSMAYMEKLLMQWQQQGVATPEQARLKREAWRQTGSHTASPLNPALNYPQREYRDEDFGEDFFVNYDKRDEQL